FEMRAGKRAFARPTASETMAAILRDDPPELSGSGRPIPAALERIVQHCLEKSPERRFHSALDVAFALQNVSLSEATTVAPISAPFARENRRATRIWAALSVLAFAGAGLAGWALRGGAASL